MRTSVARMVLLVNYIGLEGRIDADMRIHVLHEARWIGLQVVIQQTLDLVVLKLPSASG